MNAEASCGVCGIPFRTDDQSADGGTADRCSRWCDAAYQLPSVARVLTDHGYATVVADLGGNVRGLEITGPDGHGWVASYDDRWYLGRDGGDSDDIGDAADGGTVSGPWEGNASRIAAWIAGEIIR